MRSPDALDTVNAAIDASTLTCVFDSGPGYRCVR